MRRVLALFILLCIVLHVSAQNAQRIIPVSSRLYDDLAALYAFSWMVVPSQAKPYTAEQFQMYLDALPKENFSSAARSTYDNIRREISQVEPVYTEGSFAADISGSLSMVMYRHDQLAGEKRETGTYRWLFGYEERSPLIHIPFEVWAFNNFYADLEFNLRQDYRTIDDTQSYAGKEARGSDDTWINVSSNLVSYDIFFPFRGFMSVGGKHWTVQFGRDQLSWGGGRTGNFMISDYPDFFDHLRLSGYWRGFSFTSMYSVFDPNLSAGETYLALAAHRFEFNLFDKAVISVSEAMSFGANSLPELISDMNPVMIFHSWLIPERANSLLTLELDIAVLPFQRVYGHAVLDELVTSVEKKDGATEKVNAMGYMAGTETILPLHTGILYLRSEWVLTDPYLYNRIGYPYFRSQRRVWSYADPAVDLYIRKPTGYEYGPDSHVIYFGAEYRGKEQYTLMLDFTMLTQGEKDLLSPYTPQPGEKTPTGTPERQNTLHAAAVWSPYKWITIGLDGWLRFTNNENHSAGLHRTDSEVALTITYSW